MARRAGCRHPGHRSLSRVAVVSASRLGGRLEILAAAALFSTGAAAIKTTTLSAWQVAGFRSALAALTLTLVLWRRGRLDRLVRLGRAPWIGLVYALALTGYVVANKLTTAANTVLLLSTAPIWVAVLSPGLLGERPSRRDLALLALVAAGMALVLGASTDPVETAPDPVLGNRVAAAAALFWALTLIGLRRLSRGEAAGADADGSLALAGVVWGNSLAFFLTLPLALPVERLECGDAAAVGYLGTVQIGAAYLFLVAGLTRVPAVEVSLLLLLEPVLNPVWAWLLHGEVPAGGAILGGGVILSALALRLRLDAGGAVSPTPPTPEPAQLSAAGSAERGGAEGEIGQ